MLPVEAPYKIYTGLDGKPLNNGYVYFGLPNENPITSPITVYWDIEGTIPAAQPLRTVNGYIMRAGAPANVFVSVEYSELVRDSKSRQVFYAKSSSEFSVFSIISALADFAAAAGSALIGFIQAGIGAIKRTLQEKVRETISVTDFGADSTGINDSYAGFNLAPDGAFVPPGTYKLSAQVLGKSFYSTGPVSLTGAGGAKIRPLLETLEGGFTAIDQSPYPGTSLNYKSEPNLVTTLGGKVLAFYRIGDAHVNGTSNITSYLVYKAYDKKTNSWGAVQTLDSQAGFDTRNMVAGINQNTGRLFCFYIQNEHITVDDLNESTRRTYLKYSDDEGATWSDRINISNSCPFPTLDNVPFGKIITFANGKLMMTIYNYHTIVTLSSVDNGLTWGNYGTVYTTPNAGDSNITEPTLVKISETNLVCIGRNIATGLASDGSVTWNFLGKRWVASTRYEVDMISYNSGKVYRCSAAGTSSMVGPTHSSGSATDGSVTWEYKGVYSVWSASTGYSIGNYVETYSAYLYQCVIAGTTGTTAPALIIAGGEEPTMAYFKSDNAGITWSGATEVKWTNSTYQTTNSPPCAIVVGSEVHVAWFSRSPEWALYHVKMDSRAFFENPSWAFSVSDGEPRSRLMRSFLFSQSNNYPYRIDCGYVNLTRMPNSRDVMAAWYDSSGGIVSPYETIIHG